MAVRLIQIKANAAKPSERMERKFYLSPPKVDTVHGMLRHLCRVDGEYASEQINSLYFDTAELEQYDKSLSGDLRKHKVRVRWYGNEDKPDGSTRSVWLELKTRQGFIGTKQRFKTEVAAEQLRPSRWHTGIIPRGLLMETLASFGYFPPKPLQPVLKISYWRYRFREMITGQGVALDCRIRSTLAIEGLGNGEKELELPGGVLEIKGTSLELPITMRPLIAMGLDWGAFSKYSVCIDAHLEQPGAYGRLSPRGRNAGSPQ